MKRLMERLAENSPAEKRADASLARQILPSSGTMIGICTTLVGLVKIVEGRIGPSRVDEYGALVGVLFLCSAGLSYMAIRNVQFPQFSHRCERIADIFFIVGLVGVVSVVLLFAFEQI
jgi:hypothetical protein